MKTALFVCVVLIISNGSKATPLSEDELDSLQYEADQEELFAGVPAFVYLNSAYRLSSGEFPKRINTTQGASNLDEKKNELLLPQTDDKNISDKKEVKRRKRQTNSHSAANTQSYQFGNNANGFGVTISKAPNGQVSASFSSSQSAGFNGLLGGGASQSASQSQSFSIGPQGFSGSAAASQAANQNHNFGGPFFKGPNLSASQASSQSQSFGSGGLFGPGSAASSNAAAQSFGIGNNGGIGSSALTSSNAGSFGTNSLASPQHGNGFRPYRTKSNFNRRRRPSHS